jgi:hypothetical protein
MKSLLLFVCFLVASPTFGQTQKYSNADLGQPVSSRKVTPAEAAAILAPHQFQLPAPLPDGPSAFEIGGSATAGPFGEFREFSPARRLDGTFLTDPQWQPSTLLPYYGWPGGSGRGVARHGISGHHAATTSARAPRSGR